MASQPPRRSGRITKKPVPFDGGGGSAASVAAPAAPATKPPSPPDHEPLELARRGFLTALYADIEIAVSGNQNPGMNQEVRDLLRAIQLGRFIESLSPSQRKKLTTLVARYSPKKTNIQIAYQRLLSDLNDTDPTQLTRLGKLFKETRALTVCACSWSTTFTNALNLPDANVGDALGWDSIQKLICENSSSIEFFVVGRFPYDTFVPLNIHRSGHSALLVKQGPIWKLLTATQKASGNYTDSNFGNSIEEMKLHHPHLHQKVLNPHEWYLPNTTDSAERCKITYTVTSDLAKLPRTTKTVGAQETVEQIDVLDAVLLPSYVWPKRNEWPVNNKDPRYAGHWNDECEVCATEQNVCKAVTAKSHQSVARSCTCTYADLQAKNNHPVQPLLEIVRYPRLGKGVRALQNIVSGQYLGVYIGEMYPFKLKTGTMMHDVRYGGDEGECYLYTPACQPRQASNPKAGLDNQNPKALAATDVSHFYIDPAVRGNWTRYLNHSCAANATFGQLHNVGQRMLVLVRALRPIYFGDIITVDYGPDYFKGKSYACKCGESECELWDREWNCRESPNNKDNNRNQPTQEPPGTLGDAVWDGEMPQWVREDQSLPVWKANRVRLEKGSKGSGKKRKKNSTAVTKGNGAATKKAKT